jgi:hypothetical protein
MNTPRSALLRAAALLVMVACASEVHAAGFQRGVAADPDGKPLDIGIWYPSAATGRPVTMGPTTMSVALDGDARHGPPAGGDVARHRRIVPRPLRHGHRAG